MSLGVPENPIDHELSWKNTGTNKAQGNDPVKVVALEHANLTFWGVLLHLG